MLDSYVIGGQVFERVGTLHKPTSNGRTVRLTVFRTACPECGLIFDQAHNVQSSALVRASARRCTVHRGKTRVGHRNTAPEQTPGSDATPPGIVTDAAEGGGVAPRMVAPWEKHVATPAPPRKPGKGVFIDT